MSSRVSFQPGPVVAVIVPARNAEPTLDRTLGSIRGQTHSNLEIIVVDDASTDGTLRIALAHAAQDPRVRLVRNPVCAGVGEARNRGAAATDAAYIAFLDADDLMTPDSISARLEALVATGAGMAYCWSATIDAEDRVLGIPARPTASGEVYQDLLGGNFIGNGSSVLCTRAAIEATGGFSEALFKAGAQGCEDYGFYLAVAQRFRVACVPRVLVGYRVTSDNMSSDGARMVRSLKLMQAELPRGGPDLEPLLKRVENDMRLFFAVRLIRSGRVAAGVKLIARLGPNLLRPLYIHLRRSLAKARAEELLPIGSTFPHAGPPSASRAAAPTA